MLDVVGSASAKTLQAAKDSATAALSEGNTFIRSTAAQTHSIDTRSILGDAQTNGKRFRSTWIIIMTAGPSHRWAYSMESWILSQAVATIIRAPDNHISFITFHYFTDKSGSLCTTWQSVYSGLLAAIVQPDMPSGRYAIPFRDASCQHATPIRRPSSYL